MNTFLITFKPAAENAIRGWPVEELQRLARRQSDGERVVEAWRFHNRKDVSRGDRVFLLRQGKGGPAIIGYGQVVGKPENHAGIWRAPIEFESLVDPTIHVLATRDDLRRIDGAKKYWRSESSGVRLPENIAQTLEELVVGKSPRPAGDDSSLNPDWTQDELILALDVYLTHRPHLPSKDSEVIAELSGKLNKLGEKLFPTEDRARTFRNVNGVYMKLMNFRRLDPEYTAAGKTGLPRGAKAEEEVWAEFSRNAQRCQSVAAAILSSVEDSDVRGLWFESDIEEGISEAAEGRLLTRKHLVRERNRKLVESKREQALKRTGKLACEVCEFDFAIFYGGRGSGFIECHHTKPVATLTEGNKTHIDDLALVCANCHRIIHRSRPWLAISELRALLKQLGRS